MPGQICQLAISSSGDKLASSDPRTRQLALIGLVGSSLDAASAIGSLMKNSQKVVATMSFVSGVIDVYLGHQELKNAFKAGDTDTANAVFVTTSGSTVGVTGTFMALPMERFFFASLTTQKRARRLDPHEPEFSKGMKRRTEDCPHGSATTKLHSNGELHGVGKPRPAFPARRIL